LNANLTLLGAATLYQRSPRASRARAISKEFETPISAGQCWTSYCIFDGYDRYRELKAKGVQASPASFKGRNDGTRCAIWCLTRHLKPSKAVETGLAHGVTSWLTSVLCALQTLDHKHRRLAQLAPRRRQSGPLARQELNWRWLDVLCRMVFVGGMVTTRRKQHLLTAYCDKYRDGSLTT
jgi:hypothetical protein